jgi:hypothetical protein
VHEYAHAAAVTLAALHGVVVLGLVTALSIVVVLLLLRRGSHLEVGIVSSLAGASSTELRRVVRLLRTLSVQPAGMDAIEPSIPLDRKTFRELLRWRRRTAAP